MSSLTESVDRVRELLMGPYEQRPSIKQVFGAVLREYQAFYNELNNSGLNWTHEEFTVTSGSDPDYLVSGAGSTGRVLFVTAQTSSINPYPVEFTELGDASVNLAWYQPIVAARPEDYNGWGYNPLHIAFYRKGRELWARLPVNYPSGTTLTITCSTGDWINTVNLEKNAVLPGHHHLPEIRAARNLLPGATWTESAEADQMMRRNLAMSLSEQESRAADVFVIAKRSLTSDEISFRTSCDDDW